MSNNAFGAAARVRPSGPFKHPSFHDRDLREAAIRAGIPVQLSLDGLRLGCGMGAWSDMGVGGGRRTKRRTPNALVAAVRATLGTNP